MPQLCIAQDVAADELGSGTAESRVTAGSDDVEQRTTGNLVTMLSGDDLELTTDGRWQQVVGIRFDGLQIPSGATITSAYVQFQADEVGTGASAMTIQVEVSDDAPTYTAQKGAVSNRAVTGGIEWAPAAWTAVGAATADQRTPDLASLVQAVVDRPGWAPGNAIALRFSGTGTRTAESFEGSPAAAALLYVEYTT